MRRLGIELLEDRRLLSSCTQLPANISGHLAELFRIHEQRAFETAAVATNCAESSGLSDLLSFDDQGRPVVSVWTRTETAAVIQQLEGFGATVHATSDQFHLIEASLDVATLPAIVPESSRTLSSHLPSTLGG